MWPARMCRPPYLTMQKKTVNFLKIIVIVLLSWMLSACPPNQDALPSPAPSAQVDYRDLLKANYREPWVVPDTV